MHPAKSLRRVAACFGVLSATALGLAACGGSSTPAPTPAQPTQSTAAQAPPARPAAPPKPPPPAFPVVLPGAAQSGTFPWRAAVKVRERIAVRLARVSTGGADVTLARFDQRLLRLALHAGTTDPGGTGWLYGDRIGPRERRSVVAAFNGGFKFSAGVGGFQSGGRVGAPLQQGGASIVTYTDGTTDIGAWRVGVPAPGRAVESVRQDLQLLVAGGRAAATVSSCGSSCWGATLGGGAAVARSALGIGRDGSLVWAAGESLTVQALADALVGAGVTRAVELDINPQWVNGYLFAHRDAGPHVTPLLLVPGQSQGPDLFLQSYSRDFFAILARSGA